MTSADMATINDLPATAAFSFSGGSGNDSVNVVGTTQGSIVTVHGGDDDDTVILGTTGNLDHVRTTFLFVGGKGTDYLHVNDKINTSFEARQSSFDQQYIVRQNRIERSGIGVVGQFSQLEDVTLDASNETSLIRVLSTTNFTDLQLNGNGGSDRIVLGAGNASTQLNSVIHIDAAGGIDQLIIDDRFSQIPDEKYVLQGDLFQAQSIPLVAWGDSSPPEVIKLLNVGGGKDKIYVQAPVSATVFGNGGEGNDSLILLGTAGDDEATLQGDRVDTRAVGTLPTTTVVRDDDILVMRVNSQSGNDVLIVDGQSKLQETILVASHGSPGNGRVVASPFRRVDFNNTEDIDVRGNQGDFDSLRFVGTAQNDTFAINPVGDGTTLQPFVQLQNDNGSTLLKLRDASNVGTPAIRSGGGSDTFRVSMFPTGAVYPIRDMRLDAGEDPGDTDHDQLIVNYNDSVFNLIQPPANQNDGTIRLSDGNDVLDIVFRDFEEVIGDLF